jgi:hypothetical protein
MTIMGRKNSVYKNKNNKIKNKIKKTSKLK